MVAYSFRARFVPPILALTKRQTIRAERKRHARPGEELQLYTGMRTRQCKLIGRAPCVAVNEIRLNFKLRRVELDTGNCFAGPHETDAFARADGFAGWIEMETFWLDEHPEMRGVFSGVLIQWGDLLPTEEEPS